MSDPKVRLFFIREKIDDMMQYDVRNFIAHDYEGINKAIIEDVIRNHIPELKRTIDEILNQKSTL